ncbi:undecaprenyl diphosphate synthase family protein [Methanosarcinaceae archaeon]|nr:undecaprenyl diphosphate synthase family protein [Methanosarcinaceae archaeon]
MTDSKDLKKHLLPGKNDDGVCVLVMSEEIDLLGREIRFPDRASLLRMREEGISSLLIGISFLPDIHDLPGNGEKILREHIREKILSFSASSGIPVRIFEPGRNGSEISGNSGDASVSSGSGGRKDVDVSFISGPDGRSEISCIFSRFLSGSDKPAGNVLTEEDVNRSLLIPYIPDLVICCASSRLPEIMIWQTTYSELYFLNKPFPEMTSEDFFRAVGEFRDRKRRYGH